MNISSFGRRLLSAANGTFAGTIIGLGTAAFKNTGTSGNTVPLLDGVNTWSGVQTFSANPSVTGGAISFPASQIASAGANDLDDYEEGTFTPTIVGGTVAGAGTYTRQLGRYTKIGNVVFVSGDMVWTAHTGTGSMFIGALPFTSNAAYPSGKLLLQYDNLTFTGIPSAEIALNSTGALISVQATGAARAGLAMDAAASLAFSGEYHV